MSHLVRCELYTELLRLRSSLEETYDIALALAKNPDYKQILEALQVKDDARLSIIQLLLEGPFNLELEAPELIRDMQQQEYTKKKEILVARQHHP